MLSRVMKSLRDIVGVGDPNPGEVPGSKEDVSPAGVICEDCNEEEGDDHETRQLSTERNDGEREAEDLGRPDHLLMEDGFQDDDGVTLQSSAGNTHQIGGNSNQELQNEVTRLNAELVVAPQRVDQMEEEIGQNNAQLDGGVPEIRVQENEAQMGVGEQELQRMIIKLKQEKQQGASNPAKYDELVSSMDRINEKLGKLNVDVEALLQKYRDDKQRNSNAWEDIQVKLVSLSGELKAVHTDFASHQKCTQSALVKLQKRLPKTILKRTTDVKMEDHKPDKKLLTLCGTSSLAVLKKKLDPIPLRAPSPLSNQSVDAIPPMVEAIPPMVEAIPPMAEAIPPMGEAIPPMVEAIPPMVEAIPPMVEAIPPMVEAIPPMAEPHQEDKLKRSRLNDGMHHCVCGVSFKNESLLNVHLRKVTVSGDFHCLHCEERFPRLSLIQSHLTLAHGAAVKTGNSVAAGPQGLLAHSTNKARRNPGAKAGASLKPNLHRPCLVNPLKCICGYTARNSFFIGRHCGSSFPRGSRGKGAPVKKNGYPCTLCSMVFQRLRELGNHMKSHQIPTPPVGRPVGSATKRNLERAHRIVSKKRSGYFCSCGKERSTLQSLRSHILFKRNVICHQCSLHFRSEYYLKRHFVLVHRPPFRRPSNQPRKTSPCSGNEMHYRIPGTSRKCACGKRYTTKSNLTTHIRKKEEGQRFQCRDCPAKFLYFSELKVHLLLSHHVHNPEERRRITNY